MMGVCTCAVATYVMEMTSMPIVSAVVSLLRALFLEMVPTFESIATIS